MKHITILLILYSLVNISTNAQQPTYEWTKSFGGTGRDEGSSIAVDNDGNVYTFGVFKDSVDFDPSINENILVSEGGFDIFLQKLGSNGNLVWIHRFGSEWFDGAGSMVIDEDANIYLTGSYSGFVDFDPGPEVFIFNEANEASNFVLKLDADANLIWAKQIQSGQADGTAIAIDIDRNVYVTGKFFGWVDFDTGEGFQQIFTHGYQDAYVQKLDAFGNSEWTITFGGLNGTAEAISIVTDSNKNVYATGYYDVDSEFRSDIENATLNVIGGRDIFVVKINEQGQHIWSYSIGDTDWEDSSAITIDSSNKLYIVGLLREIISTEPILSQAVGFIQKLEPNGNILWEKNILSAIGRSVVTDEFNNIYIAGSYSSTVDFDPNTGVNQITAIGWSDIYVQKLTSNGTFVWAKQMGGLQSEGATSITIDNNYNIYTTGRFLYSADFNPDEGEDVLTSAGDFDMFIHKLSQPNPVGIEDYNNDITVNVSPNPSSSLFELHFDSILKDIELTVYDVKGKLLQHSNYSNTNKINIEIKQPNGVYYAKVKTEEGLKKVKLLKNN